MSSHLIQSIPMSMSPSLDGPSLDMRVEFPWVEFSGSGVPDFGVLWGVEVSWVGGMV